MPTTANPQAAYAPQGQVLKGQYVKAFRSSKGKIKGLWLQNGEQKCTVQLPKYLRPMLVRELEPGAYIQVWAYPDEGNWRGIHILPLTPQEIEALPIEDISLPNYTASAPPTCQRIKVCGKGSCCKRGGGEIFQALRQEVAANPNLQNIEIESTGCLKACKRGPNIKLPSGEIVSFARPEMAKPLLENLANSTPYPKKSLRKAD
ncbi:MAG: (2Fe-2S) ferredoxin domain-containing protein [Thainema sp.]